MNRKILSCFMFLVLVVLFAGFAHAQQKFTAALNSMQVVHAGGVESTAHGSCDVTLSPIGSGPAYGMNVTCEYSGLSGNLISAHIHDASAGQNGMLAYNLGKTGGTAGAFTEGCFMYPGMERFLFEKRFYVELNTANYPEGELRGQIRLVTLDSDVDGEGRAELSVFRPDNGIFYAYCSMNRGLITEQLAGWNSKTDSDPFLADFDGDGIAERAFIRTSKLTGELNTVYRRNKDNDYRIVQWGNYWLGDTPVFGDYDGDGKIDIAVYRRTNGVWYILQSSDNQPRYEYWGVPETDKPCPGDYDKDGKTDLCVIRAEGDHLSWNIRRSSNDQPYKVWWGLATDTTFPMNPVDVDADGANDILVMRETDGKRYFYALRSSNNSWFVLQWGLPTDRLKIGDYDADGKTDFAAIREIDNQLVWFINQSSNNQMKSFYWGMPGDK